MAEIERDEDDGERIYFAPDEAERFYAGIGELVLRAHPDLGGRPDGMDDETWTKVVGAVSTFYGQENPEIAKDREALEEAIRAGLDIAEVQAIWEASEGA